MGRKAIGRPVPTNLTAEVDLPIRFSEVDAMGIVWHGNYVQYFEEGREAFGKKYGLDYMTLYDQQYVVPIVNLQCDFKAPLRYGDKIRVRATYVDSPAAKLIYRFEIFTLPEEKLVATGESTQVFLDMNHQLVLSLPEVIVKWKQSVDLL
jgi:acyl-CoA thioester hydrolase